MKTKLQSPSGRCPEAVAELAKLVRAWTLAEAWEKECWARCKTAARKAGVDHHLVAYAQLCDQIPGASEQEAKILAVQQERLLRQMAKHEQKGL
jgi:hypothetical protein